MTSDAPLVKTLTRWPPPWHANSAKPKTVLFFWAPWHDASSPGGQMDLVITSLAESAAKRSGSASVDFCRVEAEAVPELSQKFGVTIVPTFILLDESYTTIDKIEGVDPANLTMAVQRLLTTTSTTTQEQTATQNQTTTSLNDRLQQLVSSHPVMLFMKGTPDQPRCGFSRQIVEILQSQSIDYQTFDILDPNQQDVRQGLKELFDWPTYPQLYVKGELIGGLDIVKEMVADETEDLASQLDVEKKATVAPLEQRLQKLVSRSRIVLFMKGLPSAPKCGFSRQIVELLQSVDVDGQGTPPSYDAFDILQDEEVRQGLKTFSDWPTFPQLYVDGDFVGGLDIVREMNDSGDLVDLLKG